MEDLNKRDFDCALRTQWMSWDKVKYLSDRAEKALRASAGADIE